MKSLSLLTIIFTILTLSLATSSCKKDKEDPTITVSAPAQHTMYNWGSEVHITASFMDDNGLKSYEVTVVDAADNQLNEFNFNETGTTTELTHTFHEHFVVPSDAPAMAWVHFVVTDAKDKTTTMKWMLHFEE